MGGKTSKSTQTVSIPPEVLARYNAVNARAEDVANRPFQPYSYNPADFVAQLTPTQLAGIQNVNYAAGQAQPYFDEATNQLMGAQMAAVPYYAQAEQNIGFGQQMGLGFQQQALQDYYYGRQQADPYQQAAGLNIGAAQDIGAQLAQQAYNQQAQAGAAAQPLQGLSLDTLMRAGMTGEGVSQEALGSLARAGYSAAPLQQLAQGIYGQAYQAAQPFTQAALQQYYGGLGAAGPLSQAAQQNIAAAQAGAAPYQQFATELGLAAARPVMPEALTGAQVQQYISPYLSNVVSQTQALMNQQAQQAQSEQLGNAIRSGAFGGDRAGIAAANLAQQQQLAQGKVISDLLQSGYGQALATAQQQQQLGLGAEQANRAAQQAAAGQLLGVGQAGFGQGMTAAQQQAALAQQLFGQQAAAGQNIAGLGQQAFTQGMSTGQAQQALAQQLFGQGATTAQQQAAIAQQLFGQGATQAQQQAALAQQVFGQGMSQAQQQAALSQLLFGQGTTAAQQQAALGQQLFGQGLAGSQQMAALGQQGFGQQLAAAQAQQALGQGLYGMGAGTAQQLAALGTGAQGAALQGAQAQLAAGQAQQQTAQAGLQALYNQFLQQQAYPFQVAQFLGNIAMGTGALSGSTTTTAQPGSTFSDVRTKENLRKIGKTFDGQPVYAFNYKGDSKTQMGLVAQEVERKHPEAVGEVAGLKTVDYDRATRGAARRGQVIDAEYTSSEGGSVTPRRAGLGFADGGVPPVDDPNKAAEEARQQQAAEASQKATEVAKEVARQPEKTAPTPEVDLKPDLAAQKQSQSPTSVPSALGIPTESRPAPQLAVASGDGLYKEDPRSKDAGTIASLLMFAFSDRRLKEDVKHIGYTDDGQKIYSYRIKGEPTTQIGLMADEVEKHHPDAVGSVNGFKTVDYDRATEVAANAGRKKFADGGSPGLASPADMAALLAAQAQMFGPFSQYGRPNNGMPGMPGYVPGASLPVGSLVTAGDLPQQRSAVDEFQKMLNAGQDVKDIVYPKPAPAPAPTPTQKETTTEVPGAVEGRSAEEFDKNFEANKYRGGATYADGGQVIPYATPTSLNIPTEMKTPELMKAGQLGKQRSTMDDVSDIVNIASDIKNLMKSTGGAAGRHGYQTDGRVGATGSFEDESFIDRLKRVAREIPQDVREMAGYGVTPQSASAQREKLGPFNRNYVPAPAGGLAPTSAQPPAATTPPVVTPPAATTPTQVRTPPANQRPPVDVAPPPPTGGLVPPAAVAPPAVSPAVVPPAAPAAMTPPVAPAGGLAPPAAPPATGKTTEPPKTSGGLRNWLSKPENYIPLLQGAAAAATAPTQYTLPALLVGASAYGKSYQDVRKRLAEIETEKATADQLKGATRQTNVQIAQMMQNNQIVTDGGREFVVFADGTRMLLGQYLSLSADQRGKLPLLGQAQVPELISAAGMPSAAPMAPASVTPAESPVTQAASSVVPPGTQVTPSAAVSTPQSLAQTGETQFRQNAPAGQNKWLGSEGEQQYKKDFNRLQDMPTQEKQRLIAENAKYQAGIDAAAAASVGMGQNLNQMASLILKLPEGGITAPGQLANFRQGVVRTVNDVIGTITGTLGLDPNEYQIKEEDIAKGTAADKIGRFMAFAAANGAGQNSLGGLETAQAMVPTTAQSREEAVQLLAGMYIDKQRALDMQNYVREYVELGSNSGQAEAVLINNAMNAFRREEMYNDRAYNERKRALAALMQQKNAAGVTKFEHMMKKGYSAAEIDKVAAHALYGRKDVPPIRGVANIILGI